MKTSLLVIVVLLATVAALGRTAAEASPRATVGTATTSTLGRILVDNRGRTLYLFEKDKLGRSHCSGACATYWPPLLTRARPIAGSGVTQSLLGVTNRPDGTTQVTYGGHPLYRFVQDTRPGQTSGQDLHFFGGGWYVVSRNGKKVERVGS